jgi:hypothetical protein
LRYNIGSYPAGKENKMAAQELLEFCERENSKKYILEK